MMDYENLGYKKWSVAAVFGLLLMALNLSLPTAFMFLYNTVIVIYAICIAFLLFSEKYCIFWALVAISIGVGIHGFEIYWSVKEGECKIFYNHSFLHLLLETKFHNIDECLDYSERWVLPAQASFLSGFIVIVISFVNGFRKFINMIR